MRDRAMKYEAMDLWNGQGFLQHWKYIKKIGNRYFYTMADLNAYYNAQKNMRDAQDNQIRRVYNGSKTTVRDEVRDINPKANPKKIRQARQLEKQLNNSAAEIKRLQKKNKAESAIATVKFAAKNITGGKSEEEMKQRYRKQKKKDYNKYRNKRIKILNTQVSKINKLWENFY